jgi:replicative DNA helicase
MEKSLKLPEYLLEPLILKYSARNRSFFLKIKSHLDTSRERNKSYFSDEKIQNLFNLIVRYFDKYQDFPKKETLKSLSTKYIKDQEILLLTNGLIEKMYEDLEEEIDEIYFEEEVLNFIKEAKIYEAIVESQIDIQTKNFGSIVNRVENAVRINFDKDLGISIRDVQEALRRIKQLDEEKTISTGFSNLDKFLDGGLHPKEIICLAAPPGHFKCVRKDVKIKVKYKINTETGEIL